jgi:hypothetical protein
MITVDARVLGKKKPLFTGWSVPIPREPGGDGGFTLRDLITRIVRAETDAFRKRQEARRLERVLSPAEIDAGEQRGKIDPGGRELKQAVDDDAAVGNALQAFEDGIYLVLIDGEEQRDLDRQIHLQDESRVTFLRLVLLAGA